MDFLPQIVALFGVGLVSRRQPVERAAVLADGGCIQLLPLQRVPLCCSQCRLTMR